MPEKSERRTFLKVFGHSTNTCEVVLLFYLLLKQAASLSQPSSGNTQIHLAPHCKDHCFWDGSLKALHMFCRLAIFKIHWNEARCYCQPLRVLFLHCHSVQQCTTVIFALSTRLVELVVESHLIISGPLGASVRGSTPCHYNRLNNQDACYSSKRSFAALWK